MMNYFKQIVDALCESGFDQVQICRMMLEALGESNEYINQALQECNFSKGCISANQVKVLEQNEGLNQIKEATVQQIKKDRRSESREFDIENVKALLDEFGISKKYLGYRFLMDSITVCYRKRNEAFRMCEIYAVVAERYNTTVAQVERTIRHCILMAFNSNEDIIREKFFFNEKLKKAPSNVLTIKTLVAKLF